MFSLGSRSEETKAKQQEGCQGELHSGQVDKVPSIQEPQVWGFTPTSPNHRPERVLGEVTLTTAGAKP